MEKQNIASREVSQSSTRPASKKQISNALYYSKSKTKQYSLLRGTINVHAIDGNSIINTRHIARAVNYDYRNAQPAEDSSHRIGRTGTYAERNGRHEHTLAMFAHERAVERRSWTAQRTTLKRELWYAVSFPADVEHRACEEREKCAFSNWQTSGFGKRRRPKTPSSAGSSPCSESCSSGDKRRQHRTQSAAAACSSGDGARVSLELSGWTAEACDKIISSQRCAHPAHKGKKHKQTR